MASHSTVAPVASPSHSVKPRPSAGPIHLADAHRQQPGASEAEIAARAYEKFEARGCVHGYHQEDWSMAEEELRSHTSGR